MDKKRVKVNYIISRIMTAVHKGVGGGNRRGKKRKNKKVGEWESKKFIPQKGLER